MLTLATIAFAVTVMLLVMRFVQPELIYSVRRGLMMVRTNKAFLDKLGGRADADRAFRQLLVHEARYETRTNDEIFILQDRIVKISELYRLLDLRRRLVKEQTPQVCIVELGALLSNLGRSVEANPEHNAPVMKAGALLKYIGNGVKASREERPFENDEEIDGWFIENPVSIEQVIEILIAAVVALAHRQQAAKAERSRPMLQENDLGVVWFDINRVEKQLRLLVRFRLMDKYKTEDAIFQQVRITLGERDYEDCLRRMEKVRRQTADFALDFFEFMYFAQLQTLMFKEWDVFRQIFPEKGWLNTRVERITQIRNEIAHNRHVRDDDRKVIVGYCAEIGGRIEKFNREIR